MQRYLQGWTEPPSQQTPLYQGSTLRGGYGNRIAHMVDVARIQSQAQTQQTVMEMMTRGQTGDRNSSCLTKHGLLQPMAQMARPLPQELASGFRASSVAGANSPPPELSALGLVDLGNLPSLNHDTTVLDPRGPPQTQDMSRQQILPQPEPQRLPTVFQVDDLSTQQQARYTPSAHSARAQDLPLPQPQHLTSQSQLQFQFPTELAAQHHPKGPIISHVPRDPVYLNEPFGTSGCPRRRGSQFELYEDIPAELEAQWQTKSPGLGKKGLNRPR